MHRIELKAVAINIKRCYRFVSQGISLRMCTDVCNESCHFNMKTMHNLRTTAQFGGTRRHYRPTVITSFNVKTCKTNFVGFFLNKVVSRNDNIRFSIVYKQKTIMRAVNRKRFLYSVK